MMKTFLRLSLTLLAAVAITVGLTACSDDDEPNGGGASVEERLCGKIWSTSTSDGTFWLMFDQNGTLEETRIGIPIQENRVSWYFSSDDKTAVHISGGLFATLFGNYWELSFPGDRMQLSNFGETFTFTNLTGGGGSGGNDSDQRTPTTVLCITVHTDGHNETVESEYFDWYLGYYGSSPALYKNRNDYGANYVVLGRTNPDRDCYGYDVSGFRYVATVSPILHTRVYYYFS